MSSLSSAFDRLRSAGARIEGAHEPGPILRFGRILVDERADYAEVGIAEYWIVNPFDETVTILRLDGTQYAEHGVFQHGSIATSVLLGCARRGGC